MKTSFKVGDIVKVVWLGGRVIYAIVRVDCGNFFKIEAVDSLSFESMGDLHQRMVKKNQVLSAN